MELVGTEFQGQIAKESVSTGRSVLVLEGLILSGSLHPQEL